MFWNTLTGSTNQAGVTPKRGRPQPPHDRMCSKKYNHRCLQTWEFDATVDKSCVQECRELNLAYIHPSGRGHWKTALGVDMQRLHLLPSYSREAWLAAFGRILLAPTALACVCAFPVKDYGVLATSSLRPLPQIKAAHRVFLLIRRCPVQLSLRALSRQLTGLDYLPPLCSVIIVFRGGMHLSLTPDFLTRSCSLNSYFPGLQYTVPQSSASTEGNLGLSRGQHLGPFI